MKTLTTQELKRMMDKKEDFALINVLPEQSFDEEHIPGSHNVPLKRDAFTSEVESIAGGKHRTIVVYCASRSCDASPSAAAKLKSEGFTNVFDYEDGMAGWRNAGYEVATGAGVAR